MAGGLGPFDLKGPEFLVLYLVLFVFALLAGIVIPRWLKPEGTYASVTDPDLAAYLAGQEPRFAEAVVARLLGAGAIALSGKVLTVLDAEAGTTKAELAVLRLPSPISWTAVMAALKPPAQAIRARLEELGLLMPNPEVHQLRLFQTIPFALLLFVGAIKVAVGLSREKPVAILAVLMLFTAIAGLIRFVVIDRKTRAGQRALTEAIEREDRLKSAHVPAETGLAVALFGTSVLVGSDLWDFHRMRAAASSGGDGGSDGGSGCGGGGGCGGCS